MNGKPTPNEYAMQEQFYKMEAYHYFEIYLKANAILQTQDNYKEMYRSPDAWLNQRNFTRIGTMAFFDKDCKIIQIDEDLIPLMEDTEPNYSELNMPFPAMFINRQFEIGHFKINGFLLIDLGAFRKKGNEINSDIGADNEIRVLSVTLNTKGKYEFYSIEPLMTWKKMDTRKHFFDSEEEHRDMVRGAKLINRMGANLINIIINDTKEIEMVAMHYSDEQNAKRERRGKPKHRDKLFIRLGGALKVYAQSYRKNRGEIHVRFMVRGHFKHFRHDRYKEKKGTKKWIMPFYKGIKYDKEITKRFVGLRV